MDLWPGDKPSVLSFQISQSLNDGGSDGCDGVCVWGREGSEPRNSKPNGLHRRGPVYRRLTASIPRKVGFRSQLGSSPIENMVMGVVLDVGLGRSLQLFGHAAQAYWVLNWVLSGEWALSIILGSEWPRDWAEALSNRRLNVFKGNL